MVKRSKHNFKSNSKRLDNITNITNLLGTKGGSHGRLPLPIVRGGYRNKKSKRMVRSGTRIRQGITSK